MLWSDTQLMFVSQKKKCFPFVKKTSFPGNRTRDPRVAGEDSTTEPPMRKMFLDWETNLGRLGESQES